MEVRRQKRAFSRGLLLTALNAALGIGLANAGTSQSELDSPLHRAIHLTEQALAFEHGEGVPKDPIKAAELYCEAAKLGNADAQYNLGWMYANGRGLPRDDGLAALFFEIAAYQGHPHAQRMLKYVGDPASELPECMKNKIDFVDDDHDTWEKHYGALPPERQRIVELVKQLAPTYAVDPRLALAVVSVESNFQPTARSPKNAQGLMQLIPETAQRFNVKNTFDPVQNIKGGLAYLRWLLAYFQGSVPLVAAGYNAGEGAVDRFRGVPPYQETRAYVTKILTFFRKDNHPYDEKVTGPSPVLDKVRIYK